MIKTAILTGGVAALALLAAWPAPAQEEDLLAALEAQLPGELINDPTRIDWNAHGENLRSGGRQDASIPGGGAARVFTVRRAGAQPYDMAADIPLTADINAGEVVTLGFYARTVSADTADGRGTLGVRFQENREPWGGFGDATLAIGPDWEWYEVSATATQDIPASAAIVALQLAGARQELEIGQAIAVKGAASILGARPLVADAVPEFEVPEPLLTAGRLLNDPTFRGWGDNGTGGSWEAREEPQIWLGQATRYTTTAAGENPWDLGTAIPIASAIAEGDQVLVAIAARTLSAETEDARARVGIRVQGTAPPYEGFGDATFAVGPNWQLIRVPLRATRAFAAGEAVVALHFAGAIQQVDIGPVYIFKAN